MSCLDETSALMAQYDNTYSRLVAWLKIALPLIALAILSTLFLLSRGSGPSTNIPFTDAELDEMLQEERLRAPAFAGVTEGGAALTVAATEARPAPDAPGRAVATGLAARIETPDGGWLTASAERGMIDDTQRSARLEGGVALRSSTHYEIRTQAITAWLDRTLLETRGRIVATGPAGEIEAGSMTLRMIADGQYVLDFTEGVRLIYTPPSDATGDP